GRMRRVWQGATIADAIAEAYEVVAELADQMREAFDALPEALKEYHVRREEAADWLEIASDGLCGLAPDRMRARKHQVRWVETHAGKDGKLHRRGERDNVVRSLQACIFRLSELRNEEDDALDLIRELKRIRDILRSIEFPGMST